MSGITVLSPLGINRVGSQPLAPRLKSLDGVTLGILNNSKPNSLELQRRVVELLAKQHSLGRSVTKQKPSAAIGSSAKKIELNAVTTSNASLSNGSRSSSPSRRSACGTRRAASSTRR